MPIIARDRIVYNTPCSEKAWFGLKLRYADKSKLLDELNAKNIHLDLRRISVVQGMQNADPRVVNKSIDDRFGYRRKSA